MDENTQLLIQPETTSLNNNGTTDLSSTSNLHKKQNTTSLWSISLKPNCHAYVITIITILTIFLLVIHQLLPSTSSHRSLPPPPLPSFTSSSQQPSTPITHCYPTTPKVPPHPNIPSYLSYQPNPINISYTPHSLHLNNTPSLFLSGSIHPSRNTPQTFSHALDEAVRQELNMVTMYTFWNEFQEFSFSTIDFRFSDGLWSLADAIRMAQCRGLFVHLRIGPYVCAEESYGGIPPWVALLSSSSSSSSSSSETTVEMRRFDTVWMDAMSSYVTALVGYIRQEGLWGSMGGPIILAQIENELGYNADETDDGSLEDYANWCGTLATSLEPDVVWTMCQGLSSPQTIETCNGPSCVDWIESNGISGTVQVTHPALWTEHEGGYQLWGDDPTHPTSYFWGRTARDVTRESLRWVARGGRHINYYMWQGGYNRGQLAASAIMNAYATDVMLCPDGSRHEPKYGHVRRFHHVLRESGVGEVLLRRRQEEGVVIGESVEVRREGGVWEESEGGQKMFDYGDVIFLENNDDETATIRIPGSSGDEAEIIVNMSPLSSVMLVNGTQRFNSAHVLDEDLMYVRRLDVVESHLDWVHWNEPIGYNPSYDMLFLNDTTPMEQTCLILHFNQSSNFAWFETELTIPENEQPLHQSYLTIQTQKANAFVLFIDGVFINATVDNHQDEGDVTLLLEIGDISMTLLSPGTHTVTLLSESLGYYNLIGRWGASTRAKSKGITGEVTLYGQRTDGSRVAWELVKFNDDDGNNRHQQWWLSRPGLVAGYIPNNGQYMAKGLNSERLPLSTNNYDNNNTLIIPPATWSLSRFRTPHYNPAQQSIMVDIPSLVRGVVYINGKSLGRYWNITRGTSPSVHSQRYYMIPNDYLMEIKDGGDDNGWNELLLFNVLGGDLSKVKIVLTWIEKDDDQRVQDHVETSLLCLV